MELSELKFPAMRQELVETMTSLSDRDYQQRVWIDQNHPENYVDDLTTTVTFFHDLNTDDGDFNQYIGTFLVSADEATAVEAVHQVLKAMLDDLLDSPDACYLADQRWAAVVTTATRAKTVLKQAT